MLHSDIRVANDTRLNTLVISRKVTMTQNSISEILT